ncbi:MAG: hypothetical protein B6D41_18985 [Chloroflexi bacterium UTCFX4]|jgi:hypothetical protein|nr:MAG: hypothetical protein B6D41_18985 [Chloroflexi bacterium UTCFX4]
MIQEIVIKSNAPISLKPLVESAIRGKLKLLELGIKRTQEQLAVFEQAHGMSTSEFERRFNDQDLQESLEFLDWWMEAQALHELEEEYRALKEAQLD